MNLFDFHWLDLIDILLAGLLLYQIYRLLRGTVAINILIGVAAFYLIWKLTELFRLQLLSELLGQFIGVGVLALIVVFQQEVRRFLLYVGTTSITNNHFFLKLFGKSLKNDQPQPDFKAITQACIQLGQTKTGALIVLQRKTQLGSYQQTGDALDALCSPHLIESIFNKNSPLHDGALMVTGQRLNAARCVLPVSETHNLPTHLGMRHRAALGISERTDALAIAVSEQTGQISTAINGQLQLNIEPQALENHLTQLFRY